MACTEAQSKLLVEEIGKIQRRAHGPIDRKKRKGKTMSGMPSTPRLLLAVLAVVGGRVAGEMTCKPYDDWAYYVLKDEAKCWASELNAEFAGNLHGCDSHGWVSVQLLHLAWGACRRVRARVCKAAAHVLESPVSLFFILEAERELKKSRGRRGKRGEEK